jgi:uncharacterized protein (TIGR03085 family)
VTPTSSGTDAPSASFARAERSALCDLLLEVGPDAPTLCAGWTSRDLAAHLFVRENRPDAAAGIMLAPLADHLATVQAKAASGDYDRLVASVRHGAPRWSPQSLGPVDSATNTIEYFVHHEDVRRARDGWEPRPLDDAGATELWSRFRAGARFLLRRSPVGVVAVPSDGPDAGREVRLKGGDRSVVLAGPVAEIVLSGYGRLTRGLELRGSGTDVAAFLNFDR